MVFYPMRSTRSSPQCRPTQNLPEGRAWRRRQERTRRASEAWRRANPPSAEAFAAIVSDPFGVDGLVHPYPGEEPGLVWIFAMTAHAREPVLEGERARRVWARTVDEVLAAERYVPIAFYLIPHRAMLLVVQHSDIPPEQVAYKLRVRTVVRLRRASNRPRRQPLYTIPLDGPDLIAPDPFADVQVNSTWHSAAYDPVRAVPGHMVDFQIAFTHCLPVINRLADATTDWPWSSARCYDQFADPLRPLNPHGEIRRTPGHPTVHPLYRDPARYERVVEHRFDDGRVD